MTDFDAGALCTFTSPTTTMILPHRRTVSTQSDKVVYVDAISLVFVIQDFCDMTLVYADGHVGWVYKCWIAEAKDVR